MGAASAPETRPDPQLLGRVLAAAQAQEAARIELAAAVAAARAEGHTWAELGELLGMSRQAVFKRFSREEQPPVADKTRSARTLIASADRVFADLNAGRVEAIRAGMSPPAAEVLTADALIGTWASVVRLLGPFLGCAKHSVELPGGVRAEPTAQVRGSAVVALTLRHVDGVRTGRVAYDGAGRLTGLLILPPGAPAMF